ncbi:MAG: monovalent cation/H(+) antiporter subunit G [Defluviitaleaceae bacterium]|nr:monovalent cation/H(+) antiporter subunit G [Defluviitaleaceae bacterium]
MIILSNIVIGVGLLFMAFGIVGLFRFKDFYPSMLVSSKIDTVGMLTVILGIGIRHGISFFTGKLLLIVVIFLILNPLVAHVLTRSAHAAGHRVKDDAKDTDINKEEEAL